MKHITTGMALGMALMIAMINISFAQEGTWAVVMSHGKAYTNQEWRTRTAFPDKEIKELWDKDFYITDLTYGDGIWTLVMTQTTGFTAQAWRKHTNFPKDEIKELWDKDYYITQLVYGDGAWVVVMSKGVPYTDQVWRTRTYFPKEEIKELWGQEYDINQLTYGDGVWALVMSKNTGITRQAWRTRTNFPKDEVQELWDKNYRITSLTYGDGVWALVMSQDSGYTKQHWATNKEYPKDKINEKWKEDYYITNICYGGFQTTFAQPTAKIPPVTVTPQPVKTEATQVYAVIAGVSDYNHINSLRYADDDAYKLAMFLKSPEGGALKEYDQFELLIDERATKENIINAMKKVFSKADDNDIVLFYFSGHGTDGAFLPSDFDGQSNKLLHTEVKKILESSLAKGKICIADACHAGSLTRGVRSSEIENVLDTYYTAFSSSTGGVALMMSSKSEETSLEIESRRHGLFTYYLIDGLAGRADTDRNRIVTINELFNFVKQGVETYTRGRQNPVLSGNFDQNLPIGVVRE